MRKQNFRSQTLNSIAVAALIMPLYGNTLADEAIYILPDTQYYTVRDNTIFDNTTSTGYFFPDTYNAMTQSIVDYHYDSQNGNPVKNVLHMGDVTHNNKSSEWAKAQGAHQTLRDQGIPYSLAPGNHDNPDSGDRRGTTKYNQYFGVSHFSGDPLWGNFGDNADNNYRKFSIEGHDFLSIGLEFAPRKDALCWANDLIKNNPNRHVIIYTHCYQSNGGGFRNNCAYEPAKDRFLIGSGGEVIWNELAKRHSNVRFVLSGHITDSEHKYNRVTDHDNVVHEILTDYQNEKYKSSGEKYGNGWIRRLVFDETNPTTGIGEVRVETESVLNDITSFNVGVYNSNPSHNDHNYSFTYDFNLPNYVNPAPLNDFNDFNVNKVSKGQQLNPSISGDRNGNFVVTWEDDNDKDGVYKIMANGFDGDGCQRYNEQTVSQTSGQNRNTRVAVAENGIKVVIWHRNNNIYAEGYNANGTVRFSEKIVNAVTSGIQVNAQVAIEDSGNFVVVWQDDNDGNGTYQIYARAFYSNGSPRFSRITVNKVAKGQQLNPAVAMRDDGRFYVVFEDDQDKNGKYEILAAAFNFSGSRAKNDFTVNQVSSGQQFNPEIAADSSGNFVVVWEDDADNNGKFNIKAAGFNSNYTRRFNDYRVNNNASGQQRSARVDMIKRGSLKGRFVVVWEDDADDNGYYQAYMESRSASGGGIKSDRKVHTNSDGQQLNPDVVLNNNGRAFFVWQDDLDKNGYYEIIANDMSAF